MEQPRIYRNSFNNRRFSSFTLQYRNTDLWIGTDHSSFKREMAGKVLSEVVRLWKVLENYIALHNNFLTSHSPVSLLENAPDEARRMTRAGWRTNTGPMAAVAGLFAWHAGELIRKEFGAQEVVVENGGDYYLYLKSDLSMTIYAGNSPLSQRIALIVPASENPRGGCTSSGTVGHSFSYGKADAAVVACESPVLADAWATSLGNRIKTADDIETVLNYSEAFNEIEAIILICNNKVGIRGNFETKFL